MESTLKTEPHSKSIFNYRVGTLFIVLLIILVYLFFALDTIEAQAREVSINVNGLATRYSTIQPTVGGLINELYPDSTEVISVFPDKTTPLTLGSTIFIETLPATNPLIAANLAEAQKAAAQADVIPEPAPKKIVEPRSPTYNGAATWYRRGDALTTASTQFPKGTTLRVTAINSGKYVDVVVDDYGPEPHTGVMLDLNSLAFAKLAPLGAGRIPVQYYVI
ncbi:hypothetical protein A2V68_00510 [candidate division Kazan bacterium RBG_13_50_9]|uniref:RlpA-like protein double-psi beta-barrel domain-containing protein n=1 Tax=candidate division Kazan bacterium RBG_13_50_9 TaxID=1798535 RepID=A0A1F4NSK3_UNCK3|nr:MAG: hypothetical protein A2V68_00510 [candidate division Kazan bacterium RBG_13_50_9]